MKRFSWVLLCILAGMSYGCNNDVAIDPEVAKCIAVGGLIENGKCKCDKLTDLGCKDEYDLQHTCNKGILEIFECPDNATCTECPDNATCTKCSTTCQDGERRCIKGIQVVCKDNTWNYEYKCATSCAESGRTCEKCDEQYLSCIDNIYARCENGVLIQGECPMGCDTKTKECKKCDVTITGRICNGDDVLECKDGNWEKLETCEGGQTCIKGVCKVNECSGNDVRCSGNTLQTCVDGKWNGGEPCPNGQICEGGTCKDSEPSPEKCNPDSDSVRCNSGNTGNNSKQLEFCNSDGKWEQVGPWGEVTQCVNDSVYYCTENGERKSAKCADSCNWDGSNSKCSKCDPGKLAENCTSGKCNNENVNDWNFGTCIADSGNSENPDNETESKCTEGMFKCKSEGDLGKVYKCECEDSQECKWSEGKECAHGCNGEGIDQNCSSCDEDANKSCTNKGMSCKEDGWDLGTCVCKISSKGECIDLSVKNCGEPGELRCVNVNGSGSSVYTCGSDRGWGDDITTCAQQPCNAEYTNCKGSPEVCKDGYIQCLNDRQYKECQKNGVWSDRKSLEEYEQCQNGKNGIKVDQKEKCEYFGGVFLDGQCICKSNNDELYTCTDSSCSTDSKDCRIMSCSPKKYYCFDDSLYGCNNSEMIKLQQINMGYSYKNMWKYYNDMGRTQDFNEKVIESLMELNVEKNCQYSIYIDEYLDSDCFLEYNKSTGFTCSNSNSRCPTNCSDYLQKEIDTITLINNCSGGKKTEKLQDCSIKIENCTDFDISNPDNITFKVDCSLAAT